MPHPPQQPGTQSFTVKVEEKKPFEVPEDALKKVLKGDS